MRGFATFRTGYLDRAIDDLDGVIADAREDLLDADFDTLVGTGFSGSLVVPALALAMGRKFVLVRKESDDSHHGPGRLIGNLGQRWIFVDDFISSGATCDYVFEKITIAAQAESVRTEKVGNYQYTNTSNRWQSFDDVSTNPGVIA